MTCEANALPKDMDVGDILLENNIFLKPLGMGGATKAKRNGNIAVAQSKIETQKFDAQYKKPAECYEVRDWTTQVKCTNAYIKARKTFDENRRK